MVDLPLTNPNLNPNPNPNPNLYMTHSTWWTSPSSPDATSRRASKQEVRKLAVLLTMKVSLGAAAAAAAASVRASATSTVIGFSINTCLPAARNWRPISAWHACAVQMITPSTLSSVSLSARSSSHELNSGTSLYRSLSSVLLSSWRLRNLAAVGCSLRCMIAAISAFGLRNRCGRCQP